MAFGFHLEIFEEIGLGLLPVHKAELIVDYCFLTAASNYLGTHKYRVVVFLLRLGTRLGIDIETEILSARHLHGLWIPDWRIVVQI